MAKGLRFTVVGAVYHAVLMENPLAEKIAAMCDFEDGMSAALEKAGGHIRVLCETE